MSIRKIVRLAFLSAILTVAMMAIKPLPNIELISLLVIIYTILFGKDTFIVVTVFTLIEGLMWGFGLWWVSYLYVWPLLCLIVLLLKRFIKDDFLIWAVVSGVFGLCFGSFFAIAYLPIDPAYALSYWIAGLPWDVWHGAWNFILMAVAGKPIYNVLKKVKI
ncbi:MAG: hypothetical protein FWE14_11795 [Lachnospiraceae bacterium]|nr:hypothetical protein [Lachnospiraceae bacterium]